MALENTGYLLSQADRDILKKAVDFVSRYTPREGHIPPDDGWPPMGGGGKQTGLAKAAPGGIAAISGDVPGHAVCNLAELWDDAGTIRIREKSPAQPEEIYNTTSIAIGGGDWIHWKKDGIYRIVDVDDC